MVLQLCSPIEYILPVVRVSAVTSGHSPTTNPATFESTGFLLVYVLIWSAVTGDLVRNYKMRTVSGGSGGSTVSGIGKWLKASALACSLDGSNIKVYSYIASVSAHL